MPKETSKSASEKKVVKKSETTAKAKAKAQPKDETAAKVKAKAPAKDEAEVKAKPKAAAASASGDFVFKKKASIHPNYRMITVEQTDGTTYQTRSTYSKDYLKLDIDPLTHPAWTKEANYVNVKADEVANFMKKYQGLSFLGGK